MNTTFFKYIIAFVFSVCSLSAFSQNDWENIFCDVMTGNGHSDYESYPLSDPYYGNGDFFWSKSISLESNDKCGIMLSTKGVNYEPYFAIKCNIAEAGKYRISFRFQREYGDPAVSKVDLFYTEDIEAGIESRTVVLDDAVLPTSIKDIVSNEFYIETPGEYYFGFAPADNSQNNYFQRIYFADFKIDKKNPDAQYTVTIQQKNNLTISVFDQDGNEIKDGDIVKDETVITVEATPDPGYEVTLLSANNVDITETKTFKVVENVIISAVVKPIEYMITIEDNENAVIRVFDGVRVVESGAEVYFGKTLTVTVVPKEGFEVVSIMANDEDITESKEFTVSSETTVSAVVEEVSGINDARSEDAVFYDAASGIIYTGNAVSLKVYDLSGRLVMERNDLSGSVNVSFLNEGFYTVLVDEYAFKIRK